ncbi:4a-hydroxytetrahydrobiopterin dehydratase [Nocardioides sp. CER19]|uniref:4a-hydroxytetrahydrobiopterin dehydratase n=1 Tax=Nocardioides sp. CER19 TaxID=3038538 RepID=UPI0024471332|nr:4a-hydroxytetrahydrobiopterin dehydratase [Nocardioides sp. CER19]MDH2414115.1 4a-hydroxytetrahydrobiopterin dehydratase [Nocardioides sp. CER19]
MTDDDRQVLTGHDVAAALLDDWRLLFAALHARFRTGGFAQGVAFVDRIAAEADKADHHPDVDLRYGSVRIRLSSHDVGGVTQRDVRLARVISELADGFDLTPETGKLQVVEVGLDSSDAAEIKPFWAAVLGLSDSASHDELVDPDGVLPTLWFQDTDPHDPPRQRFHFDVRVAPEQAEQRVRAAIEAGGTLVSDTSAPRFWVLSDKQGNKACITTWLGRDDAHE